MVKSTWPQIQRPRFRFLAVPDFLKVVGLERCPLNLTRINEELLEREVADPV
jgi:hypothetical protein